MLTHPLRRFALAALCAALFPLAHAQDTRPPADASAKTTLTVDANLVLVPAVIYDKKGLVTTLTQSDFALTVDGKPQTLRYFDRDTDLPLTVGLLVDTSRSQTTVLDEEQKASQKFLDSFLHPAAANHPADKAFILQFAHSAELLQDVTDSHPLLAAGLKEIGTQAPNAVDDDKDTRDTTQTANNGNNNPTNTNPNSNGGYGPYGRRSGYPGGNNPNAGNTGGNNTGHGERATGGTVFYDSVFLASNDVLARQNGRRALIVLTDGVDRHSKESLTEAIEAAQRADTVVYAIYYKGRDESRGFGPRPGGYDPYGYGGYDPYGRYPPTTGGSTDPGTYRDPDGKKILTRICIETGGRMFEVKGKGSIDQIYKQIGDELRAGYRLGFTPTLEAAGPGFHSLDLSLTNPAYQKLEIQTRNGYYTGAAKPH